MHRVLIVCRSCVSCSERARGLIDRLSHNCEIIEMTKKVNPCSYIIRCDDELEFVITHTSKSCEGMRFDAVIAPEVVAPKAAQYLKR